ncbi:MAG: DUF4271 domain-containing protein [Pseudoflavonifractor sp.]|nr:DUF4271 domain-containing protein [Pseudoflavonifractor sp.]
MRLLQDNPFQTHSHESEAPSSADELAAYSGSYAGYVTGHVGIPRPYMPGYDSGVMCVVVGMLLLVAFNFKHWARFFKTIGNDLLSVRRRANVFDDNTMSETRVLVVLIMLVCVCEAIFVYCAISIRATTMQSIFPAIGILSLSAGVFYVAQLVVYSIVGSVFSDPTGCRQWVKGFNASQAFLGLFLLIPALIVLFYPGTSAWMLVIAATLYVVARLVFVCKGFKIFYRGVGSLVYLVIYLLAVEITPLAVLYRVATQASSMGIFSTYLL